MANIEQFNLSNFMSEFRAGARPNQFAVDIAIPSALKGAINNSTLAEQKLRFMCRAASLPASAIGVAVVQFRGRDYKLPGDRQVAEWTIQCYNDQDGLIRDVMEEWSDWVIGNVDGDQYGDANSPIDIMSSGDVHQLTKNGEIIKSYKAIGIWPSFVGDIQLDFGANDQVETFPITFQVQWMESSTTRNNTGADKFARTGGASLIGLNVS